jgi:ElaB/YqjD/DUF883 family membrane-anchored ribosome-binding protein
MTSATEKLRNDLHDVATDIEELLRATAGHGSEKVAAARERIEGTLRQVRTAAQEVGNEVAERAKQAARDADHYVHDHPWTTIGIASGVGFLIGYLMGRR